MPGSSSVSVCIKGRSGGKQQVEWPGVAGACEAGRAACKKQVLPVHATRLWPAHLLSAKHKQLLQLCEVLLHICRLCLLSRCGW